MQSRGAVEELRAQGVPALRLLIEECLGFRPSPRDHPLDPRQEAELGRPPLQLVAHRAFEQRIARLNAVVRRHPLLARDDETRVAKGRQVAGHTGLGRLNDFRQLADRELVGEERAKELEPRLVAERAKAGDPVCGR